MSICHGIIKAAVTPTTMATANKLLVKQKQKALLFHWDAPLSHSASGKANMNMKQMKGFSFFLSFL